MGTKKLYTIGEVSEITGINKRTNVYKMKDIIEYRTMEYYRRRYVEN